MKTGIKVIFVLFVLFSATVSFASRIPTQRGHWSSPQPMNRLAWNIFRSVVDERIDGVKYTPTSYSLQIVNGKRYRFYCRSTVLESPKTGSALITVFVHLGGETELASIQDTTFQSVDNPSNMKKVKTGAMPSKNGSSSSQWLTEPLYPRTGPYLQAPRRTIRRL